MTAYPDTWVALDLETTGLNPRTDRIIEIGIVVVRPGQPVMPESVLVRPDTAEELPEVITQITGLKRKDLDAGMSIQQALDWLLDRMRGLGFVVGHNIWAFDWAFINTESVRAERSWQFMESRVQVLDTAGLFIAHANKRPRRDGETLADFSHRMIGERLNHQKYNLALACETLGVSREGIVAHRAAGDALAAQRLFEALREAGAGASVAKWEVARL